MRIDFRPLRPKELDHEMVWLTVGSAALAGAWVWLRYKLPWPSCTFQHLTGIPCPTCGATRCFLLLTRGKIWDAFAMNPLAFFTLLGAGVFAIYAAAVLIFRLPRVRLSLAPRAARATRVAVITVLLVNWIYLIATLPRS
jgi:uncharacterized protein DUF2752